MKKINGVYIAESYEESDLVDIPKNDYFIHVSVQRNTAKIVQKQRYGFSITDVVTTPVEDNLRILADAVNILNTLPTKGN